MKVSLASGCAATRPTMKARLPRNRAIDDNRAHRPVFVGNEAVGVRAELNGREVSDYIKRVKAAINDPAIQVGTAEVWPTWLTETDMADGADFVGIHLLPYWEGVSYDESMEYITSSFDQIAKLYPDKKIVIGETGWPSDGRVKKARCRHRPSRRPSCASSSTSRTEELRLLHHGAYDQPWKARPARRRGRCLLGHARCRRQGEVQPHGSRFVVRRVKLFAAIAPA